MKKVLKECQDYRIEIDEETGVSKYSYPFSSHRFKLVRVRPWGIELICSSKYLSIIDKEFQASIGRK